MRRFHVHVHVQDLAGSVGFYSRLFAAEPARVEADYAKWMLDDPPLNFAISTRGQAAGLGHLGIEADAPAQLAQMKSQAQAAGLALLDEGQTTCCYARSEKYWVTDPSGIAWEHFHSLGSIPVFGESAAAASPCCTPQAGAEAAAPAAETACCAPAPRGKAVGIPVKSSSGCC